MMRSAPLLALAIGSLTAPIHALGQDVAVVDVAVVDVERGAIWEGMTVLVTADRIARVEPTGSFTPPGDAQVVDGRGRFLIPGLWDMHVHSSSDRITREVFLPLYIANGVTGVRDMAGDCFDPCPAIGSSILEARRWREEIRDGRLVGPRVLSSSPIIYGPGPGEPSTIEAPATAEHGAALVRLMAERDVDLMKVYDELPRDAFFGLMEEANQLGIPVVGHVPLGVPVSEAVEAGMRSVEHLFSVIDECSTREGELRPQQVEAVKTGDVRLMYENLFRSVAAFSLEKCAELYRTVARHDAWAVPTLTTHEGGEDQEWIGDPRMVYMPREERDFWLRSAAAEVIEIPGGFSGIPILSEQIRQITIDMARAGVPILAGSDVGTSGVFPGFSLHDELELLVDAGLTTAEVLRIATLEPAVYMEATDSLGTVEPGKVGDLVLLEANPLEDIGHTRRIEAVIAGGRLYGRKALDKLLEDAEAAAAR